MELSDVDSIPKWARVEIEWIDTFSLNGWLNPKSLTEENLLEDMQFRTVGYFIEAHQQILTVVQSCRNDDDPDSVSEVLTIPLASITSISQLSCIPDKVK